jgi:hypothetical protein
LKNPNSKSNALGLSFADSRRSSFADSLWLV